MGGGIVDGSDGAFRRIYPDQIVYDDTLGRRRPSTAALLRRPNEAHASVYIKSHVTSLGLTPLAVLSGHEGFALAEIAVTTSRSAGFDVVHDPLDPARPNGHPCDAAHASLIEPLLSKAAVRRHLGKIVTSSDTVVLVDPQGP